MQSTVAASVFAVWVVGHDIDGHAARASHLAQPAAANRPTGQVAQFTPPVLLLYFPASHMMQSVIALFAVPAAKRPAGQEMQPTDSASALISTYFPATQAEQSEATLPDWSLYCPAGQALQLAALVTVPVLNRPAEHVAQPLLPAMYEPSGQLSNGQASVGLAAPETAPNLPAGQSTHVLELTASVAVLYLPGGQSSHLSSPTLLNFPAGQMLQCDAPSLTPPVPSVSEPELAVKCPAPQIKHAASETSPQPVPNVSAGHLAHSAAELIEPPCRKYQMDTRRHSWRRRLRYIAQSGRKDSA